ncbi:unnamed protein product, partial [Didymodactylos carnosus]
EQRKRDLFKLLFSPYNMPTVGEFLQPVQRRPQSSSVQSPIQKNSEISSIIERSLSKSNGEHVNLELKSVPEISSKYMGPCGG